MTNNPHNHLHLINEFEEEREITYRKERYRVRDNGAVFRLNRYRRRARPLDKQWTFGRQTPSTGYMLLAGVRVHQIVCRAFQGDPPTDQHVVDHIDTNRANNRPENLRWVTRLENVLLNPISARRIELAYGSIDAFFDNPAKVQTSTDFPDISWMRTLTKEEAQNARDRLSLWAESGTIPSGGAIGEWLYGRAASKSALEYRSLSASVIQGRGSGTRDASSPENLERQEKLVAANPPWEATKTHRESPGRPPLRADPISTPRECSDPANSCAAFMDLRYSINFVGYDEWVASGYTHELAGGDVISRDGEVLGKWRVVNYDLEESNPSGRYEFISNGQSDVTFMEAIGFLDSGLRRGLALSEITRKIREWHEAPRT